jgi:type IV pilus assembly protein PilA
MSAPAPSRRVAEVRRFTNYLRTRQEELRPTFGDEPVWPSPSGWDWVRRPIALCTLVVVCVAFTGCGGTASDPKDVAKDADDSGQRAKGQDSDAKANARNRLSEVESCFSDTEDYSQCHTNTGTVKVTGGSADYTIVSASKSGNFFTITNSGGSYVRTCNTSGGTAEGGCQANNW